VRSSEETFITTQVHVPTHHEMLVGVVATELTTLREGYPLFCSTKLFSRRLPKAPEISRIISGVLCTQVGQERL
jgi:hypothetical protein